MKSIIRRGKKLASVVLIASLIGSFSSAGVNAADGISDFVNRCYKVAFQRDADEGGFNYWKEQIENGKIDGSVTVQNFIFSKEYLDQKTDDKQYVKDCYTMFMGREPDSSGYDYWCGKLNSGMSRADLFAGFANSEEFYSLCNTYGITAGCYTNDYPLEKVNNVNLFVERLYKICLGRIGDQSGQNYWVEGLLKGELTGVACAANYIMSQEYENKNLSSEDYVKNLYIAFMGREFDQAGLDYWLGQMSGGVTRKAVFAGFANSQEFQNICASYGIVGGFYEIPEDELTEKTEPVATPTPIPTPVPTAVPTSKPSSSVDTSVIDNETEKVTFVVNTSTHKFHTTSCTKVHQIKPENYATTEATYEEMIEAGYSPCQICLKTR